MRPRRASLALVRVLAFLMLALSASAGIFGSTLAAGAVGPACTLSPTSGVVGTTITVNCTGFTAGELVRVWWDALNSTVQPYGTFTAGATGAGSDTFAAPNAVRGVHAVIAKGAKSLGQASVNFTVNPSMTLSATSGVVGASEVVKVTGYAANESVQLN